MGESSVFIGDGAADCGRIAALAVFETAADTEFAMAVFAADCPKFAGIFAFAGVVAGDHAFIIVGGFQFEQMIAASAAIGRLGLRSITPSPPADSICFRKSMAWALSRAGVCWMMRIGACGWRSNQRCNTAKR